MTYKSYLVEPQEVEDILLEIEGKDEEIVSTVYLSNSQQVLLICKTQEGKPYLRSVRRGGDDETEGE